MRILVLESDFGTAIRYEDALRAAGHDLVRCHEPGAPAFPCAGVVDHSTCPLDEGAVDAAILVRDPIAERPSAREAGVACAIRARVPVLEPATDEHDPFAGYVERVEGDLVAAVELAVRRPSAGHAAAIKERLLATPPAAGIDPDSVVVTAQRDGRALGVVIDLPADAPGDLRTAAAAWTVGAARAYDPTLQTIDVTLR
jgi:hypothetical protein